MARTFAATDKISYGDVTILDAATSYSVSMWIKPSSTPGGARYISKMSATGSPFAANQAFQLGVDDVLGTKLRILASDGSARAISDTTSAVLTTGAWQHCGASWVTPNTIAIYYNGASQAVTVVLADSPTAIADISANLTLGLADDTGASMLGDMCEVALWVNVVLNANEWGALARGVLARYIRPASLVFYAPLWGIHTSEPDFSKTHLAAGTITGTSRANHAPVRLMAHPPTNVEVTAGPVVTSKRSTFLTMFPV